MQATSTRQTGNIAFLSAASLRTWHANVSAFIAPMILFFSLSGAMQIVGLQDAHDNYRPNALISAVARLHKQQTIAAPPKRRPAPAAGRNVEPPSIAKPPSLAGVLLKGLFFIEALALATTTVLGVWIGLTHVKRKRTCWLLLGAGTIVPLILVFF